MYINNRLFGEKKKQYIKKGGEKKKNLKDNQIYIRTNFIYLFVTLYIYILLF